MPPTTLRLNPEGGYAIGIHLTPLGLDAALINLAETLYMDLAPRGIGVWIVNPGFVKTPLTDRNEFTMPALISAEEAASQIIAGLASGRFEIHFPKRFTRWLKLFRLLPYGLYFRLVRRLTGL